MTTKEIAEKMIADIQKKNNTNSYGEFESDWYEIMPKKFVKITDEEGFYSVSIFTEESKRDNIPYDVEETNGTSIGEVISALDYLVKKETFKTGKMVVITSDGKISTADYTGLESMQQAVGGYIERFYSGKIGTAIDGFCNEEFLFINTEECKRVNVISSALSNNVICGTAIFVGYESRNGDTRGLNEQETEKLIQTFKKIKEGNMRYNIYFDMEY